jgi:hypothetical protein
VQPEGLGNLIKIIHLIIVIKVRLFLDRLKYLKLLNKTFDAVFPVITEEYLPHINGQDFRLFEHNMQVRQLYLICKSQSWVLLLI